MKSEMKNKGGMRVGVESGGVKTKYKRYVFVTSVNISFSVDDLSTSLTLDLRTLTICTSFFTEIRLFDGYIKMRFFCKLFI